MQKLRTPHFWQAIYLATLALFLACLFGGVLGVATISCRLSFDARCDARLCSVCRRTFPPWRKTVPRRWILCMSTTPCRPGATACG